MLETIGYIACLTQLFVFIQKNERNFLIGNAIATLLYGLSVESFGGSTGAIISFWGVIVSISSIFLSDKHKRIIKYSVLLVAIITALFYFKEEQFRVIIPIIGVVFASFAVMQPNILKIKQVMVLSACTWLLYGILLQSPQAILFDIIGLTVLLYSIVRLKKDIKYNIENQKLI
jgi:uncharacterized MnhB-related membrane protein